MDYLELLDKEDVKGLEDYLETHDVNEELQNQTLLHLAVRSGILSFVKVLVSNGADVNKKDKLGRTSMEIASYFGFYDIAVFLMENGATIEGCMEKAVNSWNGEPQEEIIELLEKIK